MTNEGKYIGLNDTTSEGDSVYPYLKLGVINDIDYTTPIGKIFLNKTNETDELGFRIERDRFRNDLIFKIVKQEDNYYLYPTYHTTAEGITYGPKKDKLYIIVLTKSK